MTARGLLTLAVVVTALAAPAHAGTDRDGAGRSRTFAVVSDYKERPGHYDGVTCRGLSGPPAAPRADTCRQYYKGDALFTGSFRGTQRYNLETWIDPVDQRLHYEGPATFEAMVPGCGSGTFSIWEWDGYIDLAKGDTTTRRVPGYNRWRVLPETATGSLKGRLLGGEGENHWSADGSQGDDSYDFGRGRFTGTLTCRR